jgi:hypothetical protein
MSPSTQKKFLKKTRRLLADLKTPMSQLLFVLALAQMAWASAFKRVQLPNVNLNPLHNMDCRLDENGSHALFELSKFFAEGPSRCRFTPYKFEVKTYLLAVRDADLKQKADLAGGAFNQSSYPAAVHDQPKVRVSIIISNLI